LLYFLLVAIILSPTFLNTWKVWAQSTMITIQVGESPQSMEYNSSNGKIYVSNSDSGDVSVMDSGSNKVIHTIDAGDSPQFLKYNLSNGNIYVTNENSDNVSLITTNETNSTALNFVLNKLMIVLFLIFIFLFVMWKSSKYSHFVHSQVLP